jgi:hypothetical protein
MKYLLFLLVSLATYAQEKSNTVDSLVNAHVTEFRKFINNDKAYVYVDFDYMLSMDHVDFSDNDLKLESGIDAKKLEKNSEYFLIRFLFYYEDKLLKMKGVNFRITKVNNKKISLNNMGNGKEYDLD